MSISSTKRQVQITVYYTEDSPHVQIELPDKSVGWALISVYFCDTIPDGFGEVEEGIRRILGRKAFDRYIAEFTKRDRLSIGFRVRVIYAEKVQAIAHEVGEFIASLAKQMDFEDVYGHVRGEDYEVVVEQAPPEIAKYIIGA